MDQGSLDANAQIFHSGYCAALFLSWRFIIALIQPNPIIVARSVSLPDHIAVEKL